MAKEVRLDIAGTIYREGDFVRLSTHREVFDGAPSVGNCICGELNAELMIPSEAIPRNAEMVPYIREEGSSAWKKQSVFFVYSRDVDELIGQVSIVAYDAIYRGEESFTKEGEQGEWPRVDIDVMDEIARRTGTTVCAETRAKMTGGYLVQYPGFINADGEMVPDGDGALTMREVAGRIAAFYAGNWIIDKNGEWRLVILGDIPEETNLLITEDGEPIKLGNDRIIVEFGKEEPHRLVVQNGDALLIGGVRLLV